MSNGVLLTPGVSSPLKSTGQATEQYGIRTPETWHSGEPLKCRKCIATMMKVLKCTLLFNTSVINSKTVIWFLGAVILLLIHSENNDALQL